MRIGSVKELNVYLERHMPGSENTVKTSAENFKNASFEDMDETEEGLYVNNPSKEDFSNLADDMDKFALEIKNTRFEFSVHEATKRVIVRIYDMNTDELISEIPPEKFLDLIANIWKQVGLIIDKKV